MISMIDCILWLMIGVFVGGSMGFVLGMIKVGGSFESLFRQDDLEDITEDEFQD